MKIDPASIPEAFRRAAARPVTLRPPASAAPSPAGVSRAPPEAANAGITPLALHGDPKEEGAKAVKFTIPGAPVGKPRQTQSDKWRKRPVVMRYRAWADRARAAARAVVEPGSDYDTICIRAYFPIPKNWSKQAKKMAAGTWHRQKPDLDNVLKAAQDALFGDDSRLAFSVAEKCWDDGNGPRLEVELE